MKKLLIILLLTSFACSKKDDVDPGIVYQDENITVYTKEGMARARARKRKFMIRPCCEFYSPTAGQVIWCVTNNGNCQWCFDEICNQGHP